MSELQEFPIPEWLNSSFLQSVLEKKSPYSLPVTIKCLDIEVGSKKGEGFVSEMFRIRVDSSLGDFSLILKKPHSNEERYNIFTPYNMFNKEIEFYSEIFPEIRKVLESVDEYEPLVPEMFYGDPVTELVIMDDLQVKGYASPDRQQRVSLEGAKVVMKKLAKLHAASMVVNKQKNGLYEDRIFHSFGVDGAMKGLLFNHLRAFHGELETWGEEFQEISQKWPHLIENFVQLANENIISKKGLNVLIHGDLWFSNVMVKNGPGEDDVEDILLIDFQIIAWGSLATDLIHFFFTSLNETDYEEHLEELLAVYHGHLERTLKKLAWPVVPTLGDIQAEIRDKSVHGVYSFIAKALQAADPDVENMVVDQDDVLRKKFQGSRINKEIKFILKFIEKCGGFEVDL